MNERNTLALVGKLAAVLGLLGAIVLAVVLSAGPALLWLSGIMLFGAILFLWTSLRELSSDLEPSPRDPIDAPGSDTPLFDGPLFDRKRQLLKQLKDVDQEHELGRTSDLDYAELARGKRQELSWVLSEIDAFLGPYRANAEELVRQMKTVVAPSSDCVCPSCSTKNDADARFCKTCGKACEQDAS